MSFFPHSWISHPSYTDTNPSSFHPLFRLLDDFDQYSRGTNNTPRHHYRSAMKTFTPKFDVKETGDAYELHGELPGIDQKDIAIEFTDAETLTIKGRVERSYSAGTPPNAGAIESSSAPAAIKDKSHQATVEDEGAVSTESTSAASESTALAPKEEDKPSEETEKFWVSERSVGEFQRSFTFPVRIDQDTVKASMKNGVLSVLVPKAKKVEYRKIEIN